jgi:hypothetical protein
LGPIPNPQSPIPNPHFSNYDLNKHNLQNFVIYIYIYKKLKTKKQYLF